MIQPRKAMPGIRSPRDLAGRSTVLALRAGLLLPHAPRGLARRERAMLPERVLDSARYHGDHRLRTPGPGCAIVPARGAAGAACRRRRAAAPAAQARSNNRTHLVWSGDASPALARLIDLLPS